VPRSRCNGKSYVLAAPRADAPAVPKAPVSLRQSPFLSPSLSPYHFLLALWFRLANSREKKTRAFRMLGLDPRADTRHYHAEPPPALQHRLSSAPARRSVSVPGSSSLWRFHFAMSGSSRLVLLRTGRLPQRANNTGTPSSLGRLHFRSKACGIVASSVIFSCHLLSVFLRANASPGKAATATAVQSRRASLVGIRSVHHGATALLLASALSPESAAFSSAR